MRRVIIESPFRGSGRWPLSMFRRWANIRYARRCVRDSLLRGESPIASHLLHTQRGILRDTDPDERKMGIDAGLAWLPIADAHVFYVDRGISTGMAWARKCTPEGMPMETRTLDPRNDRTLLPQR